MAGDPPKYFRVVKALTAAIRSGRFAPGAPVPSENELIATHAISNTTARRVLAELERGGWVTRIKGRGTFVRDSRVDRPVSRILGFTRNMIEAGRTPSTRLLSVRREKADRAITLHGRRYVLKGPICTIRRLRLADGEPMMIEKRCVSAHLCPGIEKKNLQESLYDLYERDYGLELSRIDQSLSAIVVNAAKAGFDGINSVIPALRVECVTFCAKDVVLEIEESLYRGDRYRFLVRATR